MRRIVAGIVLVGFLQIAFQICLGIGNIDREYQDAGASAGLDLGIAAPAIKPVQIPDGEIGVASVEGYPAVRSRRAVPAIHRPIESAFVADNTERVHVRPIRPAALPLTETAIAETSRRGETAARKKTSELVPRRLSSEKTDHKFFLAKALPVVKKPYDWLKSVGSLFH